MPRLKEDHTYAVGFLNESRKEFSPYQSYDSVQELEEGFSMYYSFCKHSDTPLIPVAVQKRREGEWSNSNCTRLIGIESRMIEKVDELGLVED